MKTLVFANQKGGVGKSAIAVQYAYYLALQENKRVIVIDFDHQQNTTSSFKRGGLATIADVSSSQIFKQNNLSISPSPFLIIPGDRNLLKIEKFDSEREVEGEDLSIYINAWKARQMKKRLAAGEAEDNIIIGEPNVRDLVGLITTNEHNVYATHLLNFLNRINDDFDFCIIDTNPNPDIRQLSSLIVADYVISPIQANQEAVDGIGELLNNKTIGLRSIKKYHNNKLDFIGMLYNLVDLTSQTQKDNIKEITKYHSKQLFLINSVPAVIKKTTAIPEAIAAGIPIWQIKKTSARTAWSHIRPVFQGISNRMEAG